MTLFEQTGLRALRMLDPERAHGLALSALRIGLVGLPGTITSPRLATSIAGLELPNPLGLAAGFDKNATALEPLGRAGFGFLEVGAATPRPQDGNPKPRLFRLTEDRGVINRFGFNNDGMKAIAERLAARTDAGVVGLNLGANHDSKDRAQDYVDVFEACGDHIDFATVNVSSPNTKDLRDLQGKAALWALLTGVVDARGRLSRKIPIFLKIAPDLSDADLEDIVDVVLASSIDGIIVSNTTLSRPNLKNSAGTEKGGLSGAPLFELSTRILAKTARLTEGKIPLIGVGGISTADEAYQKIKAGASALQLYSALTYEGLSLVPRLLGELDTLIAQDGHANIRDAVGSGIDSWT